MTAPDRTVALVELLAQPDPEDLIRRGYRLTQQGKPDRFELLSWLPNVHAAYVLHDLENERTR